MVPYLVLRKVGVFLVSIKLYTVLIDYWEGGKISYFIVHCKHPSMEVIFDHVLNICSDNY